MAYTINLTNGNVFATIPDGTINTTSSMTLVGKNYAGYGQFLDDNFIHLLENGANGVAPGAPLVGQLWFNTATGVLQVYNGTAFKPIGGAAAASTAPTNNTTGDLWYDTVNQQLNVWSGTVWVLVGPTYSAATGITGAIPVSITDNSAVPHLVIELYVGATPVGFISKDAAFVPSPAITGFTTIRPGITLSTAGNVPLFQGTATNSQTLSGLLPSQFMRTDLDTGTSGNLLVQKSLYVGNAGGFVINTALSTNNVTLTNSVNNANINVVANVSGTSTAVIQIDGSTGIVTIPSLQTGNGSPTSALTAYNIENAGGAGAGNIGNASTPFNTVFATTISTQNIINSGTAGTGNIGSQTTPFNTIFAKATSAQYADVAERFEADEILVPGTVVELGGAKEITRAQGDLSDKVFGVISTRPAYTMNGSAGDDNTHPAVAMTGRVPVQVVGIINKGDRLVSAGEGMARAAKPGEATAFNVIGRALVSKLDAGVGTVEAIVTIK